MGALLWAVAATLDPWVSTTLERIGFAVFLVLAGISAYGGLGSVAGAFSGAELRQALRRNG